MKKLVIIFIAVLYMGAATGATVHLHYCMNKLVSLGLIKKENGKCSRCGMKEGKDCCCKDEQKLIKLSTDHKTSENTFHLYKLASAIIQYIPEFSFTKLSSVTEENPLSHAPPRSSGVALFIRNCVFRI
jgi:hypothetical protein